MTVCNVRSARRLMHWPGIILGVWCLYNYAQHRKWGCFPESLRFEGAEAEYPLSSPSCDTTRVPWLPGAGRPGCLFLTSVRGGDVSEPCLRRACPSGSALWEQSPCTLRTCCPGITDQATSSFPMKWPELPVTGRCSPACTHRAQAGRAGVEAAAGSPPGCGNALTLTFPVFLLFISPKTQDVQKAMDERRFKDAVQLRGR